MRSVGMLCSKVSQESKGIKRNLINEELKTNFY